MSLSLNQKLSILEVVLLTVEVATTTTAIVFVLFAQIFPSFFDCGLENNLSCFFETNVYIGIGLIVLILAGFAAVSVPQHYLIKRKKLNETSN